MSYVKNEPFKFMLLQSKESFGKHTTKTIGGLLFYTRRSSVWAVIIWGLTQQSKFEALSLVRSEMSKTFLLEVSLLYLLQ